jgi:peroxiredoxin
MKFSYYSCLVCLLLLSLPAAAAAQAKDGEELKDFPPGQFSDRQKYHLTDYKGKVVVLYFFDSAWVEPSAIKLVAQKFAAEANEAANKYKDKPYKFFAVGSGTSQQAFRYANIIGLKPVIPVFADNLGILQKRYGQKIAGQKAIHVVVIGTGGSMMDDITLLQNTGANEYSYTKNGIQMALDKHNVEPKYSAKDYDPKLEPALQAFELNDYGTGMKLLSPLLTSKGKLAKSAVKLYDEVKKEGEAWKEQADQAKEDKPVLAYDLYKKVQKTFTGTKLAKEVGAPLKELAKNKTLLKELDARKELARLDAQLAQMTPAQSKMAADECKKFAKRHAGTPSGEYAKALAAEIGS